MEGATQALKESLWEMMAEDKGNAIVEVGSCRERFWRAQPPHPLKPIWTFLDGFCMVVDAKFLHCPHL